MSGQLEVRLLGGFAIHSNNFPKNMVSSQRQQTLLAYLLLHQDTPQSRQQIAFLFWPDSSDAQAQTNLRQLLYHLRHDCPMLEPFLYVDSHSLQWQSGDECWVDVVEFERLLAQVETAASASPAAAVDDEVYHWLQTAVSLYTGDLFPDCYDDWIEAHRQRLRRQYIDALQRLITLLIGRHDFAAAIPLAERLISHDPLDEAGYRRLMQLHALNNNRAGALHTYHMCTTTLRRELDVAPSPETRAQYEQILNLEQSPTRPLHAPAGELLPLVGRSREWALWQQAWKRVQAGQAHFVLIRGEAGIGKTRLLEEAARWAALQGAAVAQARAYAAQDHLAYAPVAAWLRSDALHHQLANLDTVWLVEVARLLPELLVNRPQLPAPQPLTDSWQRQRFYEAMARVVLLLTEERPLLLILDDLHWCDRETLAWLSYLLPAATGRRLLFVATVRTGSVPADHPLQTTLAAWRQERELTEIVPRPLNSDETSQLAKTVAERELEAEEAALFYQETEGNPLFIVEYARAAQEQITGLSPVVAAAGTDVLLPPRVQAVIETRLRQLSPPARELVELAAVIGRSFSFAVLLRASRQDEEQLVNSLDELWQRRIIREQEDDLYDFSHDKLRAVACAQISQTRWRWLHRQVAEALTSLHAHDTEPISTQLAAHYEQALMIPEAIDCYRQAADVAGRIYANEDVVDFLTRALELQGRLPASSERDGQELNLQAAMGPPLVALEGYSARRVTAVYHRMLELCTRLERPPDPRALRGLAIAHILQGTYNQSAVLGRQILEQATAVQDPVLLVEGHYAVGVAAFWQGEFVAARTNLEQALAHIDPSLHDVHVGRYAQDPKVVCLSRLAYTLWYLGYPEQAWQLMEESLTCPEALSHPFSLTYARTFACFLATDTQEFGRLDNEAKALAQSATRHHFGFFHKTATILKGYVLAHQGQPAAGLRLMQETLAELQQADIYLNRPIQLGWVARAYVLLDRPDEALATLQEALAVAEQRGERFYEAELRRLQGELLLAMDTPMEQVAACLQQALTVARQQQARMPELRALTSLCRLWQMAGDQEQLTAVRRSLQDCYDAFSEGKDTPDLQTGRAVLTP